MECFYIICNAKKEYSVNLGIKIQEYIEAKGGKCYIHEANEECIGEAYKYTDANLVPDDAEVVIAIGGDGTLIQAARDLQKKNLPIIGINMGRVGYLCELEAFGWEQPLDQIIQNNYIIEDRMMLTGDVFINNNFFRKNHALNDIVIYRVGPLRVINYVIYVNGEHLNTYRADGIIISTPTGSTGYSMSAGGPIVAPNAQMIVITPINSHILNQRSIVLDADDVISVKVGQGRPGEKEEVEVAFDGSDSVPLVSGDSVEIKRSNQNVKILKTSKISFLKTLSKKMKECNY